MQLFSKKLSQIYLVLFVSAFLTITGNFTFFQKTILVYPLSENWLFLGSLFLLHLTLLAILLLIFCYSKTIKPILILLLIISSVVSYSTNNYGIVFDHNMITNTFETDTSEFRDLVSFKSILYFLILGLLPSIAVWKVSLKKLTFNAQLLDRIKAFLILIVIITIVVLYFSKHYSSFFRENKSLRTYSIPIYYLYSTTKFVNSKFAISTKPFKEIGLDAKLNKKSDKRRLVILVLGETARSDHMSINGYDLKTNPYLEQEGVISFKKMTSCGTDTALSVPCMFSLLDRSSYNHVKGKNMSNVLDIINHAGVSVLWLDNNSSSKSVADRVTYKDYRSSELNSICNPECRDEGMLTNLQGFIDEQNNKDILIVLHSMGSHGPAYYKRYPKEFEVFLPVCKTNLLNKCSREEISNAYDNTILYMDYFLSKVIGLLKNNSQESDTAMFYISDHGESLGEFGIYLHGYPYFMAPDVQKKIPAFMWFDEGLTKVFDIESIKKSSELVRSHDNLFHTLLGLMDVETELYQKDMDIATK
jgi:lipid A ethanolaminephosphotransferase